MTTTSPRRSADAATPGGTAAATHRGPGRWTVPPAILYLVLVTQVPFLATLYYSLHSWNLLYPSRGVRFVGLANYASLLSDGLFYKALVNTAVLTVPVVVASALLGLVVALLLNRTFLGRGVALALFIAPFLVMETVNPIIWKNMILSPSFGLLDWALAELHLPQIDVLGQYPVIGVLIMIIWQWTPFMMLILLAGLQALPVDLLEAARIDGATRWGEFVHIVLPYLRPYLAIAALLETVLIIPAFGHIYVATYGGPGSATTNLFFYAYRLLAQQHQVGMAAAAGVFTVIVTILVVTLLLGYLRGASVREAR